MLSSRILETDTPSIALQGGRGRDGWSLWTGHRSDELQVLDLFILDCYAQLDPQQPIPTLQSTTLLILPFFPGLFLACRHVLGLVIFPWPQENCRVPSFHMVSYPAGVLA